jgi:hypothetical protein
MSLRIPVAAGLAAAALLGLSACGTRGDLERPEPGGAVAEAAGAEAPERAPPSRWGPKPADPATMNTTIREAPIEGAARDPRAGPGQPD